ncbi:azurin [Streptomyces sp. NRRL S-241]|uniref:azurin n=1 Tax=Streptomyces sp. NRRL S-241 TaxID=1463896 RepID=UPI0004C0E914|nr:azurin [Streptomyces sp. NRRL S-241]
MSDSTVTVVATDQMSYDTKEITVDTSCKEFTIRLTCSGSLPKNVMGHNLIVCKTADMQAIATEGMSQGIDKDYLKKDNPNIIAHTVMIGAEEKETSVTFDPSGLYPGGDYSFFCSFPGHIAMMKGKVTVK